MVSQLLKNIKRRYGGGFVVDHSFYLVTINLLFIIAALSTSHYFVQPELWFQRVGSVMSIFTLAFELALISRFHRFSRQRDQYQMMLLLQKHAKAEDEHKDCDNDHTTKSNQDLQNKLAVAIATTKADVEKLEGRWSQRQKLSQIIIFINVTVSTLIWGYGDLIYLAIAELFA